MHFNNRELARKTLEVYVTEFHMANKNPILEEYLRSGECFPLIFASVMVLPRKGRHAQMG